MSRPRKRAGRAGMRHARIDGWEMDTPTYTTLSPDDVALLVQFRATIGQGGDNRIWMSIRDIMDRLHIGQRRATAARDALIERGWLVLIERGGFTRKVRHASVYARTDLPIHPGHEAPKDYMRWTPSVAVATTEATPATAGPRKNTVAVATTDGSRGGYRGRSADPSRPRVGSRGSYREPDFSPSLGSRDSYTSISTTQRGGKKKSTYSPDAGRDGDEWTH